MSLDGSVVRSLTQKTFSRSRAHAVRQNISTKLGLSPVLASLTSGSLNNKERFSLGET